MEKIIMYCEKQENQRNILLDFYTDEELASWEKRYTYEYITEQNEKDKRSIIYIEGVFTEYGKKGFQEGSTYELPAEFWEEFTVTYYYLEDESGSNIIKYHLKQKSQKKFNLSDFLVNGKANKNNSMKRKIYDSDFLKYFSKEEDNCNFTKVLARGVGQGNWNEVKCECGNIILYDIGVDYSWSVPKVDNLVKRVSTFENSSIKLIISHFDVDHYQALLNLSHFQLSRVSEVFFPGWKAGKKKPKTLERFFEALNKMSIKQTPLPLECIPGDNKIGLKRARIRNINNIEIFRAASIKNTTNRNQGGIVLIVHGAYWDCLLPGDHHYEKIFDYILRFKRNCVSTVVPHHGGKAGKLRKTDWNMKINRFIFSVSEPSRYQHPLVENKVKLDQLQGFDVKKTREKDYIFDLTKLDAQWEEL